MLNAGKTYIYERDGSRIYARESGSVDRVLIGEDYNPNSLLSYASWLEIISASEDHPALRDALDRVKIIYELVKQEQTVQHHPV